MEFKKEDIDFTTDATPEEIEAIFPKTIPLGKSFGVIVKDKLLLSTKKIITQNHN